MNVTTLGIDIAKDVFQLCGINEQGKIELKKRITRGKLKEYVAKLEKRVKLSWKRVAALTFHA